MKKETKFAFKLASPKFGILGRAAEHAIDNKQEKEFIQELLDQDNDEGSRPGLKRILGEELYNELQTLR